MEIYLQIKNSCSELVTLHTSLAKLEDRWSLCGKTIRELNLILDELITNIVEHGNCDKGSMIGIRLIKGENEITLVVTDDGPEFDPTVTPAPDISLPLEERKCGGLGIHLIRKFSDSCTYKRINNRNVLTLKKYLPKECR